MKATVSRWGDSLALRIPKAAVVAANLREGDEVTVAEEAGSLRIVRADRLDIHAMIASITPEALHRDDDWLDAPAIGREIW